MTLWVSVKERLPEEQGFYLCYRPTSRTKICIRDFREWTSNSRKRFWVNGSEDKHITHWMAIKPPEIE